MKYGYFSEDAREYVITNPETPSPWINYISNMRGYCGIVSQSGGGFSFHKDPRDRRITKYRYNNVPVDRPGRYFYLKDEATGEVWSPTWQPVMKKMDSYECRHGQGYTRISSSCGVFSHEVLYYVPANHDCEIWRLRIKNNKQEARYISVYAYCEFTMWCEPESRNIQWSLHLPKANFREEMVLYDFIEPHPAFDMEANKNYVGDRPGYAFFGMSREVADFECCRDKFIGMYRSETNPVGVENGKLSNSILRGGIGCGALRTTLVVGPDEEAELVVVLGFAETVAEAAQIRDYYRSPANVETELATVRQNWSGYLSTYDVMTPSPDMNRLVNVWNQYQCKTTFDWSRYISFYENGEGRGMGTRDSCQDTLAVSAQLPERVRKRILEILSTTQFETGDCYHQYFPNGHKGDLKGFSDDQLWMIQMVYAYIMETGDLGFLDEKVKYADSVKIDSVYQHLLAALDYTERMKGPNGLPLILTADWNDTLHLWMECKEAESVLTAELYIYGLKLLAELAEKSGRGEDVARLHDRARRMTELINEKCWDGKWYIRGFGSEVIGTEKSQYAKIFLNTQTWSIISGVATPERAAQCMNSVKELLASPEGVKLIYPPFSAYDQTYGLISRYNPGRKENGIFSHANSWAIVAEALLGRGDQAFEYYTNIMPLKWNDRAEVLKTEPYVYFQTICSNDSINCGEAANSWLTGTASWMFVAASQYILGFKPTLEGLRVAPCIPGSWDGFTGKRIFRGCCYEIEVTRGAEQKLFVDGVEAPGDIIPLQQKEICRVKVVLPSC